MISDFELVLILIVPSFIGVWLVFGFFELLELLDKWSKTEKFLKK